MLYTAATVSLACFETIVHLEIELLLLTLYLVRIIYTNGFMTHESDRNLSEPAFHRKNG